MEGNDPKRQSQMMEQVGKYGAKVENLQARLSKLCDRLITVLRTEPQPERVIDKKDEQTLVPLAGDMRNYNSQLQEGIDVVQSILERLEL